MSEQVLSRYRIRPIMNILQLLLILINFQGSIINIVVNATSKSLQAAATATIRAARKSNERSYIRE